MSATLTIGGNTITMIEDAFDLTTALDERQRLKCDCIDYTGLLHFKKGAQVVLTDPVLGTIYSGYLYTDKETPVYPTGSILHSIDCVDQHYLADKRTVTGTIATPTAAGVIVVKQWNDVLKAEGVNAAAAYRIDTTQADFAQGVLSGVTSTLNVGDGNLELTKAGSDVSFTESITTDFASGTLTNMTASNNTLKPTTVSAVKFSAILQTHIGTDVAYIQIWSGSLTVGALDTLNYSIWIDSSSKANVIGLDLGFSDGTFLRATTTAIDQNGLPAAPTTDLTNNAINKWYTRAISLPAALNGKIVNSVLLVTTGQVVGNYLAYFKNIYLTSQSGSPFFSTSATVTTTNPPVVTSTVTYLPAQVSASVVQTYDPTSASRVSPAHSIDAVKLLRSSVITWVAATPATSIVQLWASYDGVNYSLCTNNSALPNLPAGSNVAGLSLYLKEVFTVTTSASSASSNNPDPTQIPSLSSVAVSLYSAPNPTSPKSDVVASYGTQAAWNTGTLINTVATAGGDLQSGALSRTWSDNLITNQTFTALFGSPTQAATGGQYQITCPATVSTEGASNLNFAGIIADFTITLDVTFVATDGSFFVYYRNPTTAWNVNRTGAYSIVGDQHTNTVGINTPANTSLGTKAFTLTNGTQYHVMIVVSGSLHQLYMNGVLQVAAIDTTLVNPGYIGVDAATPWSASAVTVKFTNFTLTPAPAVGTWVSPSTPISTLVTCGPSVISWTELNTTNPITGSIQVQTSVDGGVSYQNCTNGGTVPNIPSGTNVAGKSVIIKATLNVFLQPLAPILRQLVLRVLGAYPGSSGTRTTLPLAIDTAIRANVGSGFGTGSDGQTYTQVGTATTALTSNEMTITNTTGSCHMIYGSNTAGDVDETVRIAISASGIGAGLELRYIDSSNYYRLFASTTSLSISRNSYGISMTLGTTPVTMTAGSFYYLRFRIVGTYPTNLYGKVWPGDGSTAEPSAWTVTVSE